MKKFISAFLASVIAASMSMTSFAVDVHVKGLDETALLYDAEASGAKFSEVDDVVPYGETVYYQFLSIDNAIGLKQFNLTGSFVTEYDAVRGTSIKQQWENNSNQAVEKVEIVKKKYGNTANNYGYYLAIKLKNSSTVKDKDVIGTITLRKTGNDGFQMIDGTNTIAHPIGFTASYPKNDTDTITDKYTIMFTGDNYDGEVTLDFEKAPDNYFEVDTRGQSELLVKADTKYNYDIAEKYPSANIDFFNCYDANFNRVGELTIAAEKGSYLYQVKGDSLTPVKFVYDEYEEAFKVKTRTLGNYVISDRKLSNTTSPSSSEPASSEPDSSTPTTTTPTKPNPSTGANA